MPHLPLCVSDFQAVPAFLTKCLHLYETIIVRHGVMVIGPTGGGKSCVIKTLSSALSLLASEKIVGPKFAEVWTVACLHVRAHCM